FPLKECRFESDPRHIKDHWTLDRGLLPRRRVSPVFSRHHAPARELPVLAADHLVDRRRLARHAEREAGRVLPPGLRREMRVPLLGDHDAAVTEELREAEDVAAAHDPPRRHRVPQVVPPELLVEPGPLQRGAERAAETRLVPYLALLAGEHE